MASITASRPLTIPIEKSSYRRQYLFLAFSAVFLWLLFDYTNLDLWISSQFYDYDTKLWPYKYTFWTYQILYLGIKNVLIGYGAILLLLFGWSFKNKKLAPYRPVFLFLILCLILVPLEIAGLKEIIRKSRPEQIYQFGGTMPHTRLFESLWNEHDARNWPGGHASGGAALLSLYFAFRLYSKKWGRIALGFALLVWGLMSWDQVMRGQHFLSHNLWTLWFAWLTILLLYQKFFQKAFDRLKVKEDRF